MSYKWQILCIFIQGILIMRKTKFMINTMYDKIIIDYLVMVYLVHW